MCRGVGGYDSFAQMGSFSSSGPAGDATLPAAVTFFAGRETDASAAGCRRRERKKAGPDAVLPVVVADCR